MDSERMRKYINYRQAILFLVLLVYNYPIYAQSPIDEDSLSNKWTLILHTSIGFTPSASKKGESIWEEADNKSSSGVSYSCRIMSYSQKKVIGYGIYFYDFTHKKHHEFANQLTQAKEKTGIVYVAPQVSFIKRETAFPRCFGLIDFGVGYLQYTSNTHFQQNSSYKAKFSGIGFNLNIGCEYAFAKSWGARIEVGGIFSPMKPRGEYSFQDDSIQLRNKINLFLPSMQFGISYYL